MPLYATLGRTESGDTIPVLLWDKRPSDEKVHRAYAELLPHEYEDDCEVSYELQEGISLPKSVEDDLHTLNCLHAAGVDNWEGYSLAFTDEEED